MTIKNLNAAPILGFLAILTMTISSCCRPSDGFSEKELTLIKGADSIMRVLTIESPADKAVLRAKSRDLSAEALLSKEYEQLAELMVATVTHPSQDGVGIAGPQVGLNRRVVAVQRFDKETIQWQSAAPVEKSGMPPAEKGSDGSSEKSAEGPDARMCAPPFEVYPNVRIVWASDSLSAGPEGCLSVPDHRGEVLRSQEIVIEYVDMEALRSRCGMNRADLPMVRDTVRGFTAVIFQHEIDHLDGVLYIDRLPE